MPSWLDLLPVAAVSFVFGAFFALLVLGRRFGANLASFCDRNRRRFLHSNRFAVFALASMAAFALLTPILNVVDSSWSSSAGALTSCVLVSTLIAVLLTLAWNFLKAVLKAPQIEHQREIQQLVN